MRQWRMKCPRTNRPKRASLLATIEVAGRSESPLVAPEGAKSLPRRRENPSGRLPLNSHGRRASTLRRIASAQAEIQAILRNRRRHGLQPRTQRVWYARGVRGKNPLFFPRRLSAAFDARKRPPTRCTLQQQKKGQPHHPPRRGISSLQQTLRHQRLHAA